MNLQMTSMIKVDDLSSVNLYRAYLSVMAWYHQGDKDECLPLFDLAKKLRREFPAFSLEIRPFEHVQDRVTASHKMEDGKIITTKGELISALMQLVIKKRIGERFDPDSHPESVLRVAKRMDELLAEQQLERGEYIPEFLIDGYVSPTDDAYTESPSVLCSISINDPWSVTVQNYLYAEVVKKVFHRYLIVDDDGTVLVMSRGTDSQMLATPVNYTTQTSTMQFGSALARLPDGTYQLCTEIRGEAVKVVGVTSAEIAIKVACLKGNFGVKIFNLPLYVVKHQRQNVNTLMTEWDTHIDMQAMRYRLVNALHGIEIDWAVAHLIQKNPMLIGGVIMSHTIKDGITYAEAPFFAEQYLESLSDQMGVEVYRQRGCEGWALWKATAPIPNQIGYDALQAVAVGSTVNDAILRVCIRVTLMELGKSGEGLEIPESVCVLAEKTVFLP